MLGLNTLAGGKEGGELFQAVKSIRELAEDFDKRSGALMTDGRKTLGDISRAVNNFDRNPTRVLFGASNSSSNAQAAQQPAPAPAAPAPATARASAPAPAAQGQKRQ
jgi:phospholipid/cholesterol/gamma-HCH transport system substrate-binding protein